MEPIIEQPVEQPVTPIEEVIQPEQPVEEPKVVSNTAKVIISATALIASFTAGAQLDSEQVKVLQDDNTAKVEQIQALETEKVMLVTTRDELIANRQNVTDLYVYSQISSGRIPTVDSVISLNEVQTAYKNIVGAVNLNDHDLFVKAKEESVKRGDYVCK